MIRRDRLSASRVSLAVVSLLFVFLAVGHTFKSQDIPPRVDFAPVAAQLEKLIAHEMQDKKLSALSIALVDDQEIVWAKGFGMADPDKKIPATAETVYRVGAVSKLFTDIGVMQLVEAGKIELDAPVTNYLPNFHPRNSFGKTIILRQLMSHRSGLVREPPVGNYFDDSNPSLAQTVASLNSIELVYEPEKRIKYSNAGIGVVGFVLEKMQNQPFAKYLKQAVIEPLGLKQSAFEPEPEIVKDLAKAYMWSYDDRQFEAPSFQLGMSPAGSMYSTVTDLGRFMSVLFNDGKTTSGQILKKETLEKMWTPSRPFGTEPVAKNGFGIGFAISELQGHRRIGHGGAIYGFATELEALPEQKLGAVAVTTIDCANTVVERIAGHALKCMLAMKQKQALPILVFPDSISPQLASRVAGRYASDESTVDLIDRHGKLFLENRVMRMELKSLGDTLMVDDRLSRGMKIIPVDGGLRIGDKFYKRVEHTKPSPPPQHWHGLIGEYGWDHNILFILEKNGGLHALIEWFFSYPLTEISKDVYAFPDYGLYHGEKLIFSRDKNGLATQVEAASVVFKRRDVGTDAGATFRIKPLRPADELRKIAFESQPPQENGDFFKTDLVDLSSLDGTIKFDIRYASTNNFASMVFYDQPRAFMQRSAAEALVRAHQSLKQHGYGLLIHDSYRPWYVTKMFWEATPLDKRIFVADPSRGSRHNRGCAVDLTLYDLQTGEPVQMVSGYDEFSERAYPDYMGGASQQRWRRELLRNAMEAQGFRVYEWEWWHFDFKDWRKYAIQNLTFDKILSN